MTRAWISLALVGLTLLVYGQVHDYPFVNFDDAHYVQENTHVRGGLTVEGVRWAFSTSHAGNWHPLTWLSHMLDVELFGLDAGAHHVVNLAFHALGSVLLFLVFARMTGHVWASAGVAALFAVHPTHVESVVWIAERKDVLSGFFWMVTLGAYAWYASTPSVGRYAIVVLAFVAGLLAKPMVVTLPFVLLLLDVWPLDRLPRLGWRRLAIEKVPLLVLSAASSVVTFAVQREAGAVRALDVLPLERRIPAALVGYGEYVVKTVWPANLAVLYPHPDVIPPWQVLTALVLLVLVSGAALWTWRTRPYVAVGWFWFVGTLVPVIGLVQVGSQRIADRYLYLPSIGLFLIAAWGLAEIGRRFRVPRAALAAVALLAIVASSVVAGRQVEHWRSSVALWEQALRATEDNSRAHAHLGHALAAAARHDEAVAEYQQALRLRPDYPEALNYLGAALARRGEAEAAVPLFRRALELSPRLPHARANLATALAESGRLDEAIAEYRVALEGDPTSAYVRANLGRALVNAGRVDEGAEYLLPLVVTLLDEGQVDEALGHLEVILRKDPRHAKARPLLEDIAAAYRARKGTPP